MASRLSYFAIFLGLSALAACTQTPQSVSGTSQATAQTSSASAIAAATATPSTDAAEQKSEEVSGNNTLVVYFDFDSSELTADGISKLSAGVQYFQAHPSLKLSIEGHADERGTREYNLALGSRRAATVADYLAALGIDVLRTKQVSYGKEKPAAKGSTESAWQLNRRVEIVSGQ